MLATDLASDTCQVAVQGTAQGAGAEPPPEQWSPATIFVVTDHLTQLIVKNLFRRQGYLRYSRKGIILYRDAFREWLRQEA